MAESAAIRVELGERSYEVAVGSGNMETAASLVHRLNPEARVAVVTDENVGELYGESLLAALDAAGHEAGMVMMDAGEESKSVHALAELWDSFAGMGLDRKGIVAALGGGVVGDAAGFAAGTYMRGVDYIQVPTTVLAQVDSSVGGKVAINIPAGKNMAGLFYQPKGVIADVLTLRTLPQREVKAGLAEVVKYGIIWDADFLGYLEENAEAILALEPEAAAKVVRRSVEIKAEVVGNDETEQGLRRILNFGHTLGHALENAAGYGTYLHGEAVAWGMAVAVRLSSELGMLAYEDAERITGLLSKLCGIPTPAGIDAGAIVEGTRRDKKAMAGRVNYVLAEGAGRVVVRNDIDEALVRKAVEGHVSRG
ncbi:MAG: 3-dehydroquinate synthase [Planctomycetes bacterium]|nr:3-dehydroquinate synthase [Planctomycetota bacterium]